MDAWRRKACVFTVYFHDIPTIRHLFTLLLSIEVLLSSEVMLSSCLHAVLVALVPELATFAT